MFALPTFLLSESEREHRHKARERRLALAIDWTPDIKWAPELTIRGASYPTRSLFAVKPCGPDINKTGGDEVALSPDHTFAYCEKLIPAGTALQTLYGRRVGNVIFDAPVVVPALHERERFSARYEFLPWMSLTPMEMITLRPGTQRAKGHVVIAGLGLGHQLIEVSRRKQVKRLVLVERSRELCGWLLPKITPHLGRPIDDIVIGDAHIELPKLEADVALVDIFPDYGGNKFYAPCPGIKSIWCWGSADR